MIPDFTQSIAAGKTAAEETRKLAAELALANATGKWSPESSGFAVQGLSAAATYMAQIVGVLEAMDGQLKEMFGQPGEAAAAAAKTPAAMGSSGAAASLLNLLLKGAEVERAEKRAEKSPRGKWPPAGRRRR